MPNAFVHAPWMMSSQQQDGAQAIIGRDYPAPIVDHAKAREIALKLYSAASGKRA